MKKLLFLSLISITSLSVLAQGMLSKDTSKTQDLYVGNLVKSSLENIHLVKKKVDDDLSEKAFQEYLQKIDYGKQFLIQSDVNELKKYSKQMDDQLISGEFELINLTAKIQTKRYQEIKGYLSEITSKPFDFNQADSLETDGKKRKFVNSSEELKALWTKLLKYEVMSRFVELKEDRESQLKGTFDKEKEKKKKKNKKSVSEDLKKKSDAELEIIARKEVKENYEKIFNRLSKEDQNDRKEKFYNSITRIYDPHTDYMIPDNKADFDIDMSGKLEGIGALLREDGNYIKVQEIIVGSASWKTKQLDPDDTILKVGQGKTEPVSIVGMAIRDAVKLIRGKKGTEVRLTVKKATGLVKEIPIIRDTVELEEGYVKSSVITTPDGKKLGYIILPKFYRDFQSSNPRNCSDDTKAELEKLKKEGVDGLIFDLRNNGGGSLEDARIISGLFYDKGPVVQVKESTGKVQVLEDTDSTVVFDKPMVVMINAYSASASEIVAGALQDYKRAVIVGGEHSHGKGTVQTVVDLKNFLQFPMFNKMDLGAIKITVQNFYRVNGLSTQFIGVTPDIIYPDPLDVFDTGEKHLDYAIPHDAIKPANYVMWTKAKYDVKKINEETQKRVKENPRFTKIFERIKLAKEKKDKTLKSLKLADFEKEMDEAKKLYDEEKEDSYAKNSSLKIKVTSSFKQKDFQKEKVKEFEEALKKDVYLEDTLVILKEMIKG